MEYEYVRMRRFPAGESNNNNNNNVNNSMNPGMEAPEGQRYSSQDLFRDPSGSYGHGPESHQSQRILRNAPPAPSLSSMASQYIQEPLLEYSRDSNRGRRYEEGGGHGYGSSQSYDPAYPLDDQPLIFKSQKGGGQFEPRLERPPRFDPREELVNTRFEAGGVGGNCNNPSVDGRRRTGDLESSSFREDFSRRDGDSWTSGRVWKEPEVVRTELEYSYRKRLDSRDDELDRMLEQNQLDRFGDNSTKQFTRPSRSLADPYGEGEEERKDKERRSSESYYQGKSSVSSGDTFGELFTRQPRGTEAGGGKGIDWQLPSIKSHTDAVETYGQVEGVSSGAAELGMRGSEPGASSLGSQTTFRRKITHVDGQIGFAGTDLFFQKSKVVGPLSPRLGDWVIVKAEKVQSMPFDWNALSVEVENPTVESDIRRQFQTQEQIPLILPSSQGTYTIDLVDKPLKSILKHKPPPPPQISAQRTSQPQAPNYRNRSPSPESPLILFENIIPEKTRSPSPKRHQKVSPGRKTRKESPPRARKRSRSPGSRRSRRHDSRSESRSPRRSPRRISRSPRRSPRHLSRSPRRSPRRLSRSPRRSPRRLSRSPRRSPRRLSRSPRRSPRRPSRSPRRSPRRLSKSPRRSPRRLSRSPRRSPRRLSRSPRRSPGRPSRSPAPKAKKPNSEKPTQQKPPEPSKKPIPVSFTWVKSAKEPNQPKPQAPPKKPKQKEQLPAYRLVKTALNELKKQQPAPEQPSPKPLLDPAELKRTVQNIQTVKEQLQQANQQRRGNVQKHTALTNIPLLPMPTSQPAYYSEPVYPPPFVQQQQPSYYPQTPCPYPPNSYAQPYVTPQYPFPNIPNQYQLPQQQMHGGYSQPPVQYPHHQQPPMAQNMYPPGENPPSQILRTTMGGNSNNSVKNIQSQQKSKKKTKTGNPVLLKNPFHKNLVQDLEPLPPGTESGQSAPSNPAKNDQASVSQTAKETITLEDPDAGKSQNKPIQLDDLSDDEICTIYVKPASALFEDLSASEQETSPARPSRRKSKDNSPGKQSTVENNHNYQQDLQPVSDEDPVQEEDEKDKTDVMDPKRAVALGCHPNRASEARHWMICVRCAQRGHLHEMCDKERVPRALPFEISMAKALLKDSKKKQGLLEGTQRTSSERLETAERPVETSGESRSSQGTSPGTRTSGKEVPQGKTGTFGRNDLTKKPLTENIQAWEEERQRLKQKLVSKGPKKPDEATRKEKEKSSSQSAKDPKSKESESSKSQPTKSKTVSRSPPKTSTFPSTSAAPGGKSTKSPTPVKVSPQKTIIPKTNPPPKTSSTGGSQPITKSKGKPGPLSSKLTQRRKELLEAREHMDSKGKGSGSRERRLSKERYESKGRDSNPDESVVRISRRRSMSPRDFHPTPPPPQIQLFHDPMRAVAVKQLEIKSLELRDLELQQRMKLLMAEQERMEIIRHPEPPRIYDSQEHGGHPPSRGNQFCYICLGTGHRARDCLDECPSWVRNKIRVPEGFVIEKSRGLLEPFCLSCGKVGHFTRHCRYRNNRDGVYSDDD